MFRNCELVFVLFLYHSAAESEISYKYELLDTVHAEDNIDIRAKNVALLVEDSPTNFQNALTFFQTNKNLNSMDDSIESDFWLITFNSSGVSTVWAKSLEDKNKFQESLEYLASKSNPETELLSNKSLPLFAIINTARALPKHGAIIIFSQFVINKDKHLENTALDSILSKNITVYVINNKENTANNVLSNLLEVSGGRKLRISPPPRNENYKYKAHIVPSKISVILSRNNLTNLSELSFVIDNNVTAIHITISPTTTSGVLISPSGYRFSFSNQSHRIQYLQGLDFENDNIFFEIHLNFSMSSRSPVGTWMLQTKNFVQPYDVSVFAFSTSNTQTAFPTNDNGLTKEQYILGKSDLYPIQSITVEVGLGSELILAHRKSGEIYFEVTNWGTSDQRVEFSCSDSRSILHRLSIYRRNLEPQESTLVTLYIDATDGTYQDEITFSVTTKYQIIQKKVILNVGSSQQLDTTAPELYYTYKSDCTEILPFACSTGSWTIEITARDVDSGLLQISTEPKGLHVTNGYTSGSKESVIGHYSDSCCNPDLQISVVDRLNNKRIIAVNAYHARLSIGVISAIVLGILVFIILVIVITVVVLKSRASTESYDLPTYKGGNI